jgi:serine/threonine protein kinase
VHELTRAQAGDTCDLAVRDEASTTVFELPVLTQLDYLPRSDRPDSLGRLGRYEMLSVIGNGLTGLVFKALDTGLNRQVAVKPLSPELAANAEVRARFIREAQRAATVIHPHVELVDGMSLRERIEQAGMLRLREILVIGSQIAAGLEAAHRLGLLHCDLKPANVLFENGLERVKIVDFGMATVLDDFSGKPSGEVPGTPQYMSPERIRRLKIDARSDLFSLGSVMYAMCTGRSPFRGTTLQAVISRVCGETPRPIHEVNLDVPPFLSDIIIKLLAKKPDDRFQSAAEVLSLLEQHLARLQPPVSLPAEIPVLPVTKAVASMTASAELPKGSGCLMRGGAAAFLICLAATGLGIRRDRPPPGVSYGKTTSIKGSACTTVRETRRQP